MLLDSNRECRFLGIAIGGAFGGAVSLTLVLGANCAIAQITPDTTLPNNSTVKLEGNIRTIEGGTLAGGNLFHSFQEFSVPTGTEAYFNNAVDIQNIISRVTGKSISNIDGAIRANGTANLFLINPNGIIFGSNASLNIGGSFLASTASAIKFADGKEFSATNSQTTPLLSINVPIGLQYGSNAGSIQVQRSVLQIQPGKTLALVGGDVKLDGGIMLASSGRIELGGLAEPGTVKLNVDNNNLNLNFPQGVERADLSLVNRALVDVTAGGGDIAINARNLNILGESFVQAGIGQGLGSVSSKAGDITLNATGVMAIDTSYVYNFIQAGGVGSGGDINIQASSLLLKGDPSFNRSAQIGANTLEQGTGNSGNIRINAGSVSLADNALLVSETYGQGNTGTISMQVENGVSVSNYSFILNGLRPGAIGNGGKIEINAKSVSVSDSALSASTNYNTQGKAGNIEINADDFVKISGVIPGSGSSAGLFTTAEDTGNGGAGDIIVKTNALSVSNGAVLSARTRNSYPGGNISVNVNTLEATNGGQLFSTASSSGRAGNITVIAANSITISGSDPTYADRVAQFGLSIPFSVNVDTDGPYSGLFTRRAFGTGSAGNLKIHTGQLVVSNGGKVSASTIPATEGRGGNLTVIASNLVDLTGVSGDDRSPSGLFTETTGPADAGNLTVETGRLMVRDGAEISASTKGEVRFRLATEVDDAGQLLSTAQSVDVQPEGTELRSISGKLTSDNDVDLFRIFITGGGTFSATTLGGSDFDTQLFLFNANGFGVYSNDDDLNFQQINGDYRFPSLLSTLPTNHPLTPKSRGIYYLGISSYNNQPLSSEGLIFQSGFSTDINRPIGSGGQLPLSNWNNNGSESGNYTITLSGAEFLSSAIAKPLSDPPAGKGGSITINANSFEATNGGKVLTTASSNGRAGSITFNNIKDVTLSGSGSQLLASTDINSTGNGGSITLNNVRQLNVLDGAQISVSSAGLGNAGNLEISSGSIKLNQGELAGRTASGRGGDISLQVQDLILMRNGSAIATTAANNGSGGNIKINVPFIVADKRENSDILANAAQGSGGRIEINATGIYGLENRSKLPPNLNISEINASSDFGLDGTIEINTPDLDPNRGLVALPIEVVDAARLIDQNFCAAATGTGSSFTITGKGGLPPSPNSALNSNDVWEDWRFNTVPSGDVRRQAAPRLLSRDFQPTTATPEPIVEATGWVKNAKGEVFLTATSSTVTPHSPWFNPTSCLGSSY